MPTLIHKGPYNIKNLNNELLKIPGMYVFNEQAPYALRYIDDTLIITYPDNVPERSIIKAILRHDYKIVSVIKPTVQEICNKAKLRIETSNINIETKHVLISFITDLQEALD